MMRRAPWGISIIALAVFGSSHAQAPTAPAPTAQAPTAQTQPPPVQSMPAQPAQPVPAQPAQPQSVSVPPAPAQGGYSAPALYNYANAFARAGKPGFAVLNYERARLLDPSDPDIDANLNQVLVASGLPPETHTQFERMTALAGTRTLAWLGVLGLLIAGIGALRLRFYPRHRRKFAVATLLGIVVLVVSFADAVTLWPIMHEAVVITKTAPVRVSPTLIEETLFVLPEATIVSTGAAHDGFVLVRTAAGRTGWTPSTNLAPIVPRQADHGNAG
jgi:hypothetical protein